MDLVAEKLQKYGDLECDSSLAKHTTFRIGGNAKYVMYPKTEMALLRVIEICKEENIQYRVFGKGSNILCSDEYYDGMVLCLDRYFNEFVFEEDGSCYVQSGTSLIMLAQQAMMNSFTGLEFASGIPATLGGALFMNAGAYKSDMSDIVKRVYVLRDNKYEWMNIEELSYSYRHTLFHEKRDWIIVGCELKLEKGNQSEIRALMDSRRQRRMESQPLDKPNCGSVFRNHESAPAWKLIEEIGYRGKKLGGAQVSDKHANFIVNNGDAKAVEVLQLIQGIQSEIKNKYGFDMITEVEKFNWKD